MLLHISPCTIVGGQLFLFLVLYINPVYSIIKEKREWLILVRFSLNFCAPFSVFKILAHYVTTCQIKKPDFVNCSTNAVQKLFDEIPSGIPEIGLDPLDPLKVPIIKVNVFLPFRKNILKLRNPDVSFLHNFIILIISRILRKISVI